MVRVVREDAWIPTDRMLFAGIDTSRGPIMRIGPVSEMFFNRSAWWLRDKIDKGLYLDGDLVYPSDSDGKDRMFTLSDVELIAHSLTKSNLIEVEELRAALRVVRSVAIVKRYIDP